MSDGTPTVYRARAGDATDLRAGMQGQEFNVLLDGRPGGNAEGSPLCQLGIVMRPGKVSTVHVHREVNVYVRLERCGPQGVLTLYGDRLEGEEWLFEDQTLWIPPDVPHVAVYPRFHDSPNAVAVETRTTPDPDADVVPLHHLRHVLEDRLDELDLARLLDLPRSGA